MVVSWLDLTGHRCCKFLFSWVLFDPVDPFAKSTAVQDSINAQLPKASCILATRSLRELVFFIAFLNLIIHGHEDTHREGIVFILHMEWASHRQLLGLSTCK